MESERITELLTENMKTVFGFSLTRLQDVNEAEELTSDILYQLVRSADKLEDPDRFYAYMWSTAEHVYADYIRKKTRRRKRVAALDDVEDRADDNTSALDGMIKRESIAALRRELSLLSRRYREVVVMHYMDGKTCAEIAKRLGMSSDMVKYCLFRARNILREGMDMERLYGEKSYRPHRFEIDFWGDRAGDDNEYREFQRRKIKGNILLAAYWSAATAQEISLELGVSMPYLEDEIAALLERKYLIETKDGKYRTNIPIITSDSRRAVIESIESAVKETADRIMNASDEFERVFADRFADENTTRWQKILFTMHFTLLECDRNMEELPSGGAYSLVNGGGGHGVVWGRSSDGDEDVIGNTIRGIYNGSISTDGRGSVIAMNFAQLSGAGNYMGIELDPAVAVACGGFRALPQKWREYMTEHGYVKDGGPSFAVYTDDDYDRIRVMLADCVRAMTELYEKTVAAAVDYAPEHIKKTAEYVFALNGGFDCIDLTVAELCRRGQLAPTSGKPAMCVVKARQG